MVYQGMVVGPGDVRKYTVRQLHSRFSGTNKLNVRLYAAESATGLYIKVVYSYLRNDRPTLLKSSYLIFV
jgi:hypothetical protein